MDLTYTHYPIKVIKWEHKTPTDFLGNNKEYDLDYGINISSYDLSSPDEYTFKIAIKKTIENEFNGIVFYAETESIFKCKIDKDKLPDNKLVFLFIELASRDFAEVFHERKQNTNLLHHKIAVPQIENLQKGIQTYVDKWDRLERYTALN